eukprot:gene1935-2612_t
MNDTSPKPSHGASAPPAAADVPPVETLRPVAYLELKAAALLLFTLALIVGSGLYLLYARGAFEPTQTLVLTADDSEGVVVGMDMTFSGFPIGRVRRIELAESGNARILVDVPRKDAHWLRESSVFTLVRGLVGGTNIRAYSGILTDPALPDGAVRPVLRGDATAEIPLGQRSRTDASADGRCARHGVRHDSRGPACGTRWPRRRRAAEMADDRAAQPERLDRPEGSRWQEGRRLLAVTEPGGGSDVANLRTKAVRDGDHYVVNGSKTFITSGMRADYLTVAVRTGGDGMGGVSLLVIEAGTPGFSRSPLSKMGWWCSDTAT